MTPELETRLVTETNDLLDFAETLDKKSPEYRAVMDEIRKNCTVLTAELKANNEAEKAFDDREQQLKMREMELRQQKEFHEQQQLDEIEWKAKELREKRKDRWINAGIAVGTVVFNGVLYVAMYKAGLQFEEQGSVTSLFFKNFLGKLKPS